VSITKRNVPNDDDWRRVKYMVFDAPALNAPFKVRYERFKAAIEKAASPYMVCVPHIECDGMEHLKDEL
jgi:DNA ligase-1